MSFGGTTLGLAVEEFILRMMVWSITGAVFFAEHESEEKDRGMSCMRCLSDRQDGGLELFAGRGEAAAVVPHARYVRLPHCTASAHDVGKPMPLPPKLDSLEPTSDNHHDFCLQIVTANGARAMAV
jgi:hypothetical protein